MTILHTVDPEEGIDPYDTEYTVRVTNSFSGDTYEVIVKAETPHSALSKMKESFSSRSNLLYEVLP